MERKAWHLLAALQTRRRADLLFRSIRHRFNDIDATMPFPGHDGVPGALEASSMHSDYESALTITKEWPP